MLKTGALFGEMAVFDRSERSTDAISNGGTKCFTIARSDFELLLDFNRDIAYKVLWACVRLLSVRPSDTIDLAGPVPKRVASALGHASREAFLSEYDRRTAAVRALYEEHMA